MRRTGRPSSHSRKVTAATEPPGVTPRGKDLVAGAVLAGLALLVAWPVLLGQTLYYGDITLQFVPWRAFAREQLQHGVLPFWLPSVYCGTPFVANDQSAVFYPFHWLVLPLDAAHQIAVGYALHLFGAAAGVALAARSLGRTRSAAVLAGLAYGLGGFVVSKQQFPSLADTIAWFGWLLWVAQRCRDGRTSGPAAIAAVAVVSGWQWLAGHAQMAALQLALITAWLVCRRWSPATRAEVGRWLVGVALGTGLALVQLLPTFELLRWSPRADFGFAEAARFNLPPWQAAMFWLPRLFGTPHGAVPYLGDGPHWEMTGYVGVLTLALAAAAWRRERFWAAVAVVGLALAMGRWLPLYGGLFKVVPLLRLGRDPARFLIYTSLALSLMAARGLDEQADPRRWCRAFTVALAGALVWLLLADPVRPVTWLLSWSPTKQPSNLPALAAAWREDAVIGCLLALLPLGLALRLQRGGWPRVAFVAIIAADLVGQAVGLNPTAPARLYAADARPAAVPADALIWVPLKSFEKLPQGCFNNAHYTPPGCAAESRQWLVPNTNVGWGVAQLAGYDPLRAAAVVRWLQAVETWPEALREERLAALGVAGELRDGRWRPYAGVAGRARSAGASLTAWQPTCNRWLIEAPGGQPVELTLSALPGWQTLGGTPLPTALPVVRRWQTHPAGGSLRLWYAPLSLRLGLFGSLWAVAALAAIVTTCSTRVRLRISNGPRGVV